MRARELSEAIMATEADDSDGPEIVILVNNIPHRVDRVVSVTGQIAYVVCVEMGEVP